MDFRILGSLEVWDGERQIELGGPKRRAVLAFLLLHANEVVGVDRLVDQLWGEKAPRNAAAALHTHVSRLRKELGPEVIARRSWGYVLRAEPEAIDLVRFERLVADAERLPARERAEKLREGLELWRGPPLEDVAFEPALAKEIARLEELRLTVLENRIDAELEAGNYKGLVGELELLIAQHPLRERLRGQLILTLYRSGRQAEALEVYRGTRRLLADELGLEPSPQLRELERAILRHDPALQPAPQAEDAAKSRQDVQPARRRRFYVGASLALILAGLGTAAAYAISTHTTRTAQKQTTRIPTLKQNHHQTGSRSYVGTAGQPTTPANTRKTQHQKTMTHRNGVTTNVTAEKTTTATTTSTEQHPQHKKKATGPKPMPVRISDTFSDPTLDPLIWNSWSNGTGTSFTQSNGQLVFSIAADATFDPQFHGAASNLGTQCKFPGDFDARLDFSLLQWPTANGAAISLIADKAATLEEIQRFTAPWGDGYNAWPTGTAATPLPDQSGTLRMTRKQGIIRVYFSHDNNWREIGRTTFNGEIAIWISVGTFQKYWQGQNASAAIDNFTLTAPDANCPAGSDPRNP